MVRFFGAGQSSERYYSLFYLIAAKEGLEPSTRLAG
jgi:hypothetical protein